MLLNFEKRLKKELSHELDNEKPNAWNNIENSLIASTNENEAPIDIIQPNGGKKSPSYWILRPVRIFAIVLIFALSSISVLAIANPDVRGFLLSAFSNNVDAIDATFVGAKAESSGFTLTVDAIVPQANSFYLFFTLTDAENRLQKDIISFEDWSFNIDGNTGWSAYHIDEIKNGKPAYIVFSLADAKKLSGKKSIDLSIESLKLDTSKSTTVDIPLSEKNFIPVKGFKINQIQISDGYVNLAIDIDKDVNIKEFIIDSIKIINKINGKEYDFIEEHGTQDADSSILKAKKTSQKIDNNMDPNDYIIRVKFLENVKIHPALKVEFTADINNKALAVINPNELYITETHYDRVIKSKLLKVRVNQLSINFEFKKPKPLPLETQETIVIPGKNSADVKTNDSPIFSSVHEPMESRNISISYEDGTKLQTIIMNTEIKYSQLVSRSILLKEPLDLSRKPTLYIGDISIPLYN